MSTSNNLSIIIELFENQRYVPLRGWSSSNLLISDRHTFTSEFGDKFNTLEEASQDLLSKGWVWEENDWKLDTEISENHTPTNESDGIWDYRIDFGGFKKYNSINLMNDISEFLKRTLFILEGNKQLENSYLLGGVSKETLRSYSQTFYPKTEAEAEEKISELLNDIGIDNLVKLSDIHDVSGNTPSGENIILNSNSDRFPQKPNKTMMDFVRRRRYTRKLIFKVETICEVQTLSNHHYDNIEVDKLSFLLLSSLASASFNLYPRNYSLSKIFALKNEILNKLNLFDQNNYIEGYNFNKLYSTLNSFSKESRTALSAVSSLMLGKSSHQANYNSNSSDFENSIEAASVIKEIIENLESHVPMRLLEIHFRNIFPLQERILLSQLILRKLDIDYLFHCGGNPLESENKYTAIPIFNPIGFKTDINHGVCPGDSNCLFVKYSCPHSPCATILSKKWMYIHESQVCVEKVIACDCSSVIESSKNDSIPSISAEKIDASEKFDNGDVKFAILEENEQCGFIKKKNLKNHLANDCILRIVDCPYLNLGCKKCLQFRQLESHIKDDVHVHLSLMHTRIQEYESLLSKHHHSIDDINTKLIAATGAVAALTATCANEIKKVETKCISYTDSKVSAIDEKYRNLIAKTSTDIRNDMRKLHR